MLGYTISKNWNFNNNFYRVQISILRNSCSNLFFLVKNKLGNLIKNYWVLEKFSIKFFKYFRLKKLKFSMRATIWIYIIYNIIFNIIS